MKCPNCRVEMNHRKRLLTERWGCPECSEWILGAIE